MRSTRCTHNLPRGCFFLGSGYEPDTSLSKTKSNSLRCIPCTPGQFKPSNGNFGCTECPPGMISSSGRSVCSFCPAGWCVWRSGDLASVVCVDASSQASGKLHSRTVHQAHTQTRVARLFSMSIRDLVVTESFGVLSLWGWAVCTRALAMYEEELCCWLALRPLESAVAVSLIGAFFVVVVISLLQLFPKHVCGHWGW